METKSFRKLERVTNRSRFRAVYEQGEWKSSKNFTAVICSNSAGVKRLGITVTKKAGGAVVRNRIKRLMREYFRQHKTLFPAHHDVILMSRKNMPPLTFQQTCRELTELLLRKANT